MKRMLLIVISILFISLFSTITLTQEAQQQENITYTPSEETHCINGTCTLTMYSGVRYVFEDNVWKLIENAKSLKSVWNKVYLEKDPDFDIDILEVNYTDLVLNLSFYPSSNITELIQKYPECNASKENDIKCDFKLTVKEDIWNETSGEYYKSETKFQYKYQEKNGVKEALKFTQKGIPLGKEYTFGGNSTTITLNETNGGNVGDTYTRQYYPTYNYGIANVAGLSNASTNNQISFIKWNLSIIPAGSTINNANFSFYGLQNSQDKITYTYAYNTSVTNGTGTTTQWNEGTLNGVDCGSRCNLDQNMTWNNMPSFNILQSKMSNTTAYGNYQWWYFNVTNATITTFSNTTNPVNQTMSLGIIINFSSGGAGFFYSKEYTTDTTKRPQLVITYTTPSDTTPPTYSQNSTNSTIAGTPVSHNLKWTDETGLSGYIFSFDNCTGSLANDTFVSFSGTTNWSNVTKTINSTAGCTIQWKVYANDTSNNWNNSLTYSYVTTSAAQQYNRTATDYSTSGDASFKLSMLKRKQTDSSALSDLLNDWSKYIRKQTEYTTSSDLYQDLQKLFRRISDYTTGSESSNRIASLKRLIYNYITSTDSAIRKALFNRKATDIATSSDTTSRIRKLIRTITDYITSSDYYKKRLWFYRRILEYTTGYDSYKVQTTGVTDNVAPLLENISVSPSTNYIGNGITIQCDSVDAISSVDKVWSQIIVPTTQNTYYRENVSLSYISNNIYKLVYGNTYTEGTYYVEYIFANDTLNNINTSTQNTTFSIIKHGFGGGLVIYPGIVLGAPIYIEKEEIKYDVRSIFFILLTIIAILLIYNKYFKKQIKSEIEKNKEFKGINKLSNKYYNKLKKHLKTIKKSIKSSLKLNKPISLEI